MDKVTQNIRLLSQHPFCYWVLHRNYESSSSDLKACLEVSWALNLMFGVYGSICWPEPRRTSSNLRRKGR